MVRLIDFFKDWFAFLYKRFAWGYDFVGKGVAIFNFVGIFAILLGGLARSYVIVPVGMLAGFFLCVFLGWFLFDLLKMKTRFALQEGNRDDYWNHKLTPIQQKMLLVYLDAVNNPKKLKKLKEKVESGVL